MPFPTFPVLLLHGLVLWTPASNGTITQEERKTEIETETETESEIVIETEKENAPESGKGSVITVPHRASSTGTFSAQEFIHMYFICTSEFLFSARMENTIQLGKDCLKSSEDSHFKSIKAVV